MFFAAKDGEALYSQELTVAQIMYSLLPNSDLFIYLFIYLFIFEFGIVPYLQVLLREAHFNQSISNNQRSTVFP